MRLWRASDGELVRTAELTGSVHSVAFSPDGNYCALGTEDGVRLLRVSDGELMRTLDGDRVQYLSFSPDGSYLAASVSYRPTILKTNRLLIYQGVIIKIEKMVVSGS